MHQSQATAKGRLTIDADPHATSTPAREATRRLIRRAAAWLANWGVQAGDVVAVCAPDSIDVAVTRQAVSSIGAIIVTLSPSSPRRELYAQLCVSGARWLVTTPELFTQKLEVAVRPSAVTQTFLIGGAAAGGGAPLPE